MNVKIAGIKVALTDRELIGTGGEACVYKWQDQAVKIYHPPAPGLARDQLDLARRTLEMKLAKVQAFPAGLPATVVGPVQIVTDMHGQTIGFTMPCIEGAEPILRLGQRKWREGVMDAAAVCRLFTGLHATLTALHAADVVVGDLNDANVLVKLAEHWMIDADSMQFGSHRCVVATERYLDPKLYGADLSSAALFTPDTDWYAFAVLLFSSLLYVHPFGGVHNKLPTLLRRAEARHSIFKPDVTYPKAAVPFATLPDPLLHWFEEIFDHDRRKPPPLALLAATWSRCGSGHEHARGVCPVCHAMGKIAAADAVIVRGRCTARRVLSTRGRVLAAVWQGRLNYLYEEDGVVRREDGSPVLEQPVDPSMRFAISGATTWIGMGSQMVAVKNGAPVDRTVTGTLGHMPVFDACSRTAFRLQDEWLVDASTQMRLGKVLEGQTWLATGEKLGFGFWRAGQVTHPFLFFTDRPGIVDVHGLDLSGKIIDAACAFDDGHVAFSVALDRGGKRVHALWLIGADGVVRGTLAGGPDEHRMLASIEGKIVSGGRILTPTDDGLVLVAADLPTKVLVETKLFSDTEPFVSAGAQLVAGPGGSIHVVTTKEILHVCIS